MNCLIVVISALGLGAASHKRSRYSASQSRYIEKGDRNNIGLGLQATPSSEIPAACCGAPTPRSDECSEIRLRFIAALGWPMHIASHSVGAPHIYAAREERAAS